MRVFSQTKYRSNNASILKKRLRRWKAGFSKSWNAATARINLLESLGNQQAQSAASALENQSISVETISSLVTLVGNETLLALQEAQAARVKIAAINRDSEELRQELSVAKEALARLAEPSDWRHGIALEVSAEAATAGELRISYVISEATWSPVYNFALDTASETLSVDRKVMIQQYTGEDWADSNIVVSTSTPFDGRSFYLPHARLAQIAPPPPPIQLRSNSDQLSGVMSLAAPEPIMVEEEAQMAGAQANFQGVSVSYTLPAGTTISGVEEGTLVTLNSADFEASMSAQANWVASDRAFLIAELTNTTNEPFLPGQASFFRDGAFVNEGHIELVAAGATTELGFGLIDGISVKRNTIRRETGESGVISTSNDRIEIYELNIENVSNRAWNVKVYDAVPYSEQEDLVIDWTARPRPTETDVDGRRGVMAWAFDLESGGSKSIQLSYELEWPEGNELHLRP